MKRLKTCSIEGCDRFSESKGMCGMHYSRWTRTGTPEIRKGVDPWQHTPTPHDQCTFTITRAEVNRFRELADRLVSLNLAAAARYRAQNARDDAAEHAMAAD